MKLKINVKNVNKSIEKIEAYKKDLLAKNKIFLEKLANYGINEAKINFQKAQYDGVNDVIIEEPVWVNDTTIKITASGSSLLFIEFGTGVYYSSPIHEQADKFGFKRGEYGQGRGKNDFWYYKGEMGTNGQIPLNPSLANRGLIFTHGNPANRCMWETDKSIRNEIINIAKEVFK